LTATSKLEHNARNAMSYRESIEALRERARRELAEVSESGALALWRQRYLGRKGQVTTALRGIGNLSPDERKEAGSQANELSKELEAAFEEAIERVATARAETGSDKAVDVTLPGRKKRIGRLHPITQTLRDMLSIFVSLGFSVVEGPEVETDYYNFEALRIPPDHPARDMQDTLWIEDAKSNGSPLLLRTQTSPNQIRVMEQQEPPVRVVVPGRVYRHEATDASREWMFTQVELLAVDEGLSMADLKGTLYEFAKRMFGQERKVRFRCDYFPFVEPGVDMAIDCFICGGSGCRTCRQGGWIEVLGAGMVHPEILANMKYDPARYTGFAAGIGVERIGLLRYGVEDIRNFYANDLRFLEQF
jgi:phenylalanyl-tRNA synthetase alpha chain